MSGIRSELDLEDFLRGTNFLSASGGGVPDVQRELLLDDMKRGLELSWTPIDELAPDSLICTACFSGSIAPETFESSAEADAIAGSERLARPMVDSVHNIWFEFHEDILSVLGRPRDTA